MRIAAQGYDVVIHYNAGQERAAQIAAAIRAEHAVEAIVLNADLSQPEAPFDLVESGREFTVAEIYGLMAEGGSQPIRRIRPPRGHCLRRLRLHPDPLHDRPVHRRGRRLHPTRQFSQPRGLSPRGLAEAAIHSLEVDGE